MDIRTVKTNRDLKNAYLELSSFMLPSNITVAELCKAALINKTTFYRHYKDIFEYADIIEQEVFDRFLEGLADKDKLLTEPAGFLSSLLGHMLEEDQALSVFRGKQDSFLAKLANFLSDQYLDEDSSAAKVNEVTFIIGGLINSLGSYLYTTDWSEKSRKEFVANNSRIISDISSVKENKETFQPKQPQRPYFSDKSFWK